MKTLCLLALAASPIAWADFSYTTTTKSAGGIMAAAGDRNSTTYLKGQKMKVDSGASAIIFDFESQTITHLDNTRKSYTVSRFSDMGQALDRTGTEFSMDVKETGERKTINGFHASEVVITTEIATSQTRQAAMKMKMEMHLWITPDVPGSQEMRAFYQKNGERFPWAAMAGGHGDQGMQKAMAEVRRKMSALKGVPVLQVMKMDIGGGSEGQAAKMQQGMAQMQKQLEEMKRQGKLPPQLEQQLSRLQASSSPGGSMAETTLESSGFSNSSIPDSVFAIPSGYQQSQKNN